MNEAGLLAEECKNRALFESWYRGWDRAGIGRPCRPPALLSEEMKRAYVEGYRVRKERCLCPT